MTERSIPPLALRRIEAAQALGVSEEIFDTHIRAELPVVRVASVRLYSVAGIEKWLAANEASPLAELAQRRAAA